MLYNVKISYSIYILAHDINNILLIVWFNLRLMSHNTLWVILDTIFTANHLVDTISKPNLTATRCQQKNPNSSYK